MSGADAEPLPQPELTAAARAKLEPVVALLAADETAPSSVIEPARSWVVHVADSLSGLGFADLAAAGRIADVGAGAGFPGLVLAAMLPDAQVDLIESIARKCEFIDRAAAAGGIANARALNVRAEDWARPDSPAASPTTPSRPAPSAGSAPSPSSPRRCSATVASSSPGRGGGIRAKRPNWNAGHPGSGSG